MNFIKALQHIGHWLLSQKQEPEVKKQFFEWQNISSLLLVAYDNQLSEISDFLNACSKQNINTEVIVIYDGKPENAPNPSFKHLLLTKKQFTAFYMPKVDALHPISNITYDVLINSGNKNQLHALALTKMIKAKCKISNFQNSFIDISINTENNIKEYLKQTVVYLQMIKAK